MSRFWLTYKQSGRLLGVLILDSSSLIDARLQASVDRIDQGAAFARGHRLEPETAALVPTTAIGRMLSQEESAALVKRLERGILPKRKAAASVKRPAVKRKRARS